MNISIVWILQIYQDISKNFNEHFDKKMEHKFIKKIKNAENFKK